MTAFFVAIGAAALSVLAYLYLAHRRGEDALGDPPEGRYPNVLVPLAVAMFVWFAGTVAVAVLFFPDGLVAVVLGSTVLHVAISALLWPFVAGKVRLPTIRVPRQVVVGLAGGLVVFAGTLVMMAAMTWLYHQAGVPVPQQQIVELLADATPLEWCIIAFAATAGAPFAEEIFYRGTLLPALARWAPFAVANAVQAVVFGAVHISSLATIPLAIPLAVVGFAFGWMYHRTGSLVSVIVAHAVFNALQFALYAVTV